MRIDARDLIRAKRAYVRRLAKYVGFRQSAYPFDRLCVMLDYALSDMDAPYPVESRAYLAMHDSRNPVRTAQIDAQRSDGQQPWPPPWVFVQDWKRD